MTRDPICPARHRGRRCQRWNQPAAHWDGVHQAGRLRWPYVPPPVRLALDLTEAP